MLEKIAQALTPIIIALSIPASIILFFAGLIRLKRTPGKPVQARGTLPGGATVELGEADDAPKRRALDRDDVVEDIVARLADRLGEKLDHKCHQKDVLIGMVARIDATADTTQALAEDAVNVEKKNGAIKRGLERMNRESDAWERTKNENLVRV
jgi:hypothetical protein